jgi:hypothetical protein
MRARLTYANVTATLALFMALGGVSWAAVTLPARSVGTRELKSNAVKSSKIANGAVRRVDLAADALPQQGPAGVRGPAGPRGATGPQGAPGPQGPAACDQARLLLCSNADLPANQTVTVSVQSFEVLRTRTYRIDCAVAPGCTLSFAGPAPASSTIEDWYDSAARGIPAARRDALLTFSNGDVPSYRYVAVNAEPTALLNQAGRYQLNLRAEGLIRVAP